MTSVPHTDGSPLYVADLGEANHARVKAALEAAWHCELRSFGKLAIVDFFALQHGRICGIIEVKTRTHAAATYATVFCSVRKFDALLRHQICFGCPAVLVVEFTDELRFIRAGDIDHKRISLGGRRDRDNATAIEPMIEVPVAAMTLIRTDKLQ